MKAMRSIFLFITYSSSFLLKIELFGIIIIFETSRVSSLVFSKNFLPNHTYR